jgi:integrase
MQSAWRSWDLLQGFQAITGKKSVSPFDYRREILISLCDKAQVRYFTYHAIRHAGASLMDRNNAPIGAIQKILGHENRRTTEIYLHSIDNAEAEAIAIYEEARQKSHTTLTQKATPETEQGVNQYG